MSALPRKRDSLGPTVRGPAHEAHGVLQHAALLTVARAPSRTRLLSERMRHLRVVVVLIRISRLLSAPSSSPLLQVDGLDKMDV
jgi:hypothetical protein